VLAGVVNWHIGRCGSSVLGSLLAQHPAISYSNEIYSRYMPRRRGSSELPSLESVLDYSEQNILDGNLHLFEVKHLPDQNLGLYPHLKIYDWLNCFLSRGYCNHLLLSRRNGLRRIVSHLMAARSGQYVLKSSHGLQDLQPIKVPLERITHGFGIRSLVGWLEEYERGNFEMQKTLAALQRVKPELSWLELSYEDHIQDDPKKAYKEVCSFLDLPEVSVNLLQRKMSSKPLAEQIQNYSDVRDCLSTTRFAWMLQA